MLNWVTRFEIVVNSQSCELLRKLALQDLFEEREVRDSSGVMFRSASELQFSLLNPSLDKLIESSGIRRFFDSSPSLAVISFCPKMRRISLTVRVIFMQGERWSGLSQTCDRPVDPSLYDYRLAFRLRLLLGSLEDDNLCLKLVVVTLKCLLHQVAFSQSRVSCSRSQSNRIYCSFIWSMSASI